MNRESHHSRQSEFVNPNTWASETRHTASLQPKGRFLITSAARKSLQKGRTSLPVWFVVALLVAVGGGVLLWTLGVRPQDILFDRRTSTNVVAVDNRTLLSLCGQAVVCTSCPKKFSRARLFKLSLGEFRNRPEWAVVSKTASAKEIRLGMIFAAHKTETDVYANVILNDSSFTAFITFYLPFSRKEKTAKENFGVWEAFRFASGNGSFDLVARTIKTAESSSWTNRFKIVNHSRGHMIDQVFHLQVNPEATTFEITQRHSGTPITISHSEEKVFKTTHYFVFTALTSPFYAYVLSRPLTFKAELFCTN